MSRDLPGMRGAHELTNRFPLVVSAPDGTGMYSSILGGAFNVRGMYYL